MNKTIVAQELIKIAELLTAKEFPTDQALKKYLKEHPDADRRKHKVVKKSDTKQLKKIVDEYANSKRWQNSEDHNKALDGVSKMLKKRKDITPQQRAELEKYINQKRPNKKTDRTTKALEGGLKRWVKDYIEARKAGNVKGAKGLKKKIDKVIKEKGLDSKRVYFHFGDPDK